MMINKREHAFPIEHQLHSELPTVNQMWQRTFPTSSVQNKVIVRKVKTKSTIDGNPKYSKDDKRTNAGRIRKSSSSQF